MAAKLLTIDGRPVTAAEDQSVLEAAKEAGIRIPTLCHLEGISVVGACRLCLVEVAGSRRLLPACATRVAEGMEVLTDSDRLRSYRRMILELLFAERNHICAVCVANGHCELQSLAADLGMDHVRFEYRAPQFAIDSTHRLFGHDPNRCIVCTRCVRVCNEVEGAHTWDVGERGAATTLVADLNQPWGEAASCTACGKCVQACPTGALFHRGATAGEMQRDRSRLEFIVTAREKHQWIA